jgi:hypothetical protein
MLLQLFADSESQFHENNKSFCKNAFLPGSPGESIETRSSSQSRATRLGEFSNTQAFEAPPEGPSTGQLAERRVTDCFLSGLVSLPAFLSWVFKFAH